MRIETLLGTRVRIVGGDDREGGGTGPLVVLLHGFGAPGDDLVPLHRQMNVPRDVRFAFPEAPIDLAEALGAAYRGARAWWMIDPRSLEAAMQGERRDRSHLVPEGLAEARTAVAGLVRELERALGAPPDRTVLGGFSQGAMLTMDVALHAERTFGGLSLLSGSIVALDEWHPRLPQLRGARVVQSHGRSDPLLPFDVAVRLRDLLREAGAEVRWIEFAGPHTIPGSAIEAVGDLVRTVASE